jgi:glycosyltransferase involved in cell wall biosynthesis
MKILYITLENLSLHKGSVVHVKEIISGLRKLGLHVGLVACSLNKSEKADRFYNLNVMTFLPLRLLRSRKQPYIVSSIFLFLYLLKILSHYDIIYARDYHTVLIAFFARLMFKKKLVFEINGIANEEQRLKGDSFLNRILVFLIQKAEKMATRYSDRIVSVTSPIVSYLSTNFYCHPDKVEVIGNGVDTKRFQPFHDDTLLRQWKERLGIAKEEMVIAFVGNLARWQGVGILIESAIRLLSRGEKVKLLIVGDGPIKKDLMRRVLESGLEKEFIFTGMMGYEDIPFLINVGNICVAPFIMERNKKTGVSPLKVFEYMACGKPVVASRVEGLEFIEEEGTGQLIEPEDVIGLEKALYDLIKAPQERIDMGERGLQIARERFSWESRVTEIERVLKGLA